MRIPTHPVGQGIPVLIQDRLIVWVPAATNALGAEAALAWLRAHGFPDLGPDDWRVYYGPIGPEPTL